MISYFKYAQVLVAQIYNQGVVYTHKKRIGLRIFNC